ncbi:TMEM164-related integral membrane acyltransferase [Streptococcus hongkongensis]|nr:membrane protein [Streptococcus uberis]
MEFFSTIPVGLPHVTPIFYLGTILIALMLVVLTYKLQDSKTYARAFILLQISQILSLYIWYVFKGFPLREALPLYHCRIAMLAVFLLPNNNRYKQLFMTLGIGGTFLALLSPDYYPYSLFHVTNVAFYLGHYALLVNGVLYLTKYYKKELLPTAVLFKDLLYINFFILIVNVFTKGNYGFLMDIPIIHTHHLVFNYLLVTSGLTVMIKTVELIFKKSQEPNRNWTKATLRK